MVILGPSNEIIRAFSRILPSSDPLCTEAEAALLAAEEIRSLDLSEVLLEGDSSQVIEALPHPSKLSDWSIAKTIECTCDLLGP